MQPRTIFLLILAQAGMIAASMTVVSFAALAGKTLAGDAALATLPVSMSIVSNAVATAPMSLYMARYGRVAGFRLGAACGLLGAVSAAMAIEAGDFWWLTASMLLIGPYLASAQYYRYMAAESVPEDKAPRAISLVLLGGLLAAIIVPNTVGSLNDLFLPHAFMGAFVFIAAVTFFVQAPIALLPARPRPPAPEGTACRAPVGDSDKTVQSPGDAGDPPRGLGDFARMPAFWAAVLNAGLGYAMMSFVMTATPLAMEVCGFDAVTGSHVIQGHVVAMYLPSLFTGMLISRVGLVPMLLAGQVLFAVAFLTALNDVQILNFSLALVALGIAWNFCFVGGTALLVQILRPSERGRIQGVNELIVFGLSALASFASGVVLRYLGWQALNSVTFALLSVSALVTLWYAAHRRGGTADSPHTGPAGRAATGK